MKELILDGKYSLTETLQILNQVFLYFKSLNNGGPDKAKRLKQIFAEVPNAFKSKKIFKLMTDSVAHFSLNTDIDYSDPKYVFNFLDLSPLVGLKDHGPMFSLYRIIGIKLDINDKTQLSYRVDFDETKGLHINFDITYDNEKYPICVPLRLSTGRFGVSIELANRFKDNSEVILGLMENVKYKFWDKMSRAYKLSGRKEYVFHELDEHGLTEEALLLHFTSASPIKITNETNFKLLRDKLKAVIPSRIYKGLIDTCTCEKDILELISTNPNVRTQVFRATTQIIGAITSSPTLFSGIDATYGDPPCLDSEVRITSETRETLGEQREGKGPAHMQS